MTANPAVELRGVSWLLVKMGFVAWAEGLGTVILCMAHAAFLGAV